MYSFEKRFLYLNGISNSQILVLFENHALTSSIFGNLTLDSEKFNFACKQDFLFKLKNKHVKEATEK